MTPASSRRRGREDHGVTLILIALAMVGLLTVAAIVIDYSNVRNTRQDNKLKADVVASAGAQALAPDAVARPWRGVCGALAFLRANEPDLTLTVSHRDGAGNVLSGNPCTSLVTQECVPNTPATWAWIHVEDGTFATDIRSGYMTPDAAFPEDASVYGADNGVAAQGGCDQLAVIVSNTDPTLFGGVAGASDYDTTSRSVGRVRITIEGEGVPAFLMLERKACDTLSEQVGSGELGIVVDAASPTDPGIIHVDSSGSPAAGCNGNNGPGGWAVYSSSGPKIVARPAANGSPGIMAINALQVGAPPNAYGGSTAAGLSPAPSSGRVVSRKPVDEKYNPASGPTISTIHAAGYANAIRTSAPDGTWTTLGCGDKSGTFAATKIFVSCTGGYSPDNVTFSAATDVIFNGPVSIANGKQLFMPAARRIVVGGSTGGGLAVAGGGRLGINSTSPPFADTDAGVSSACNGREGPAWAQTTRLVIFGGRSSGGDSGALNVTGRAALCQTFVYLAGPKTSFNSTYAPQQTTDGVYAPTCLPAKPCAKPNDNNAHLVVSGTLRWSAPNQLADQPAPGAVGTEDLALWTETSTLSEIKSGGNLQARGVYFMPNGRVEMRSPASATPQDAQFIARSLQLKQGELRMRPTPSNAVQIPVLGGIGMVR